jgi:hypothetical protein
MATPHLRGGAEQYSGNIAELRRSRLILVIASICIFLSLAFRFHENVKKICFADCRDNNRRCLIVDMRIRLRFTQFTLLSRSLPSRVV